MGKQILESSKYWKFEMDKFNRDVNLNTERLEKSMLKYGFRDVDALDVKRNKDGKLQIRQGHNRFYVAQKLGIPVKYVESDDDATIYELEDTKRSWSMADYLTSHCRTKSPEYSKVREYCDESGICLQHAISMLGGRSAGGGGNFQRAFKEGTYKTKKGSTHAYVVKDVVLHLKKYGVKFYNSSFLVQAISKVVWVPELNIARMKSKIKAFSSMIEKKANLDQCLTMIEDLYNRKSSSKIPLKFLAIEAAKRRIAALYTTK